METTTVRIGQSIFIKGHITADEDLTIAGRVEGTVELHNHVLTVAGSGHVSGDLAAATVRVEGRITGNIEAAGKVEITETGVVEGDIAATRVAMADGGQFQGRMDVRRAKDKDKATPAASTKRLALAV